MLTGFVVLAEGLDVFTLRNIVAGGRRLPLGNLYFAKKKTLLELMSRC
jgi:hypothetical protein